MNIIKEIKDLHVGKVIENAYMKDYTTYKVGGKVICIVIPEDEKGLLKLLNYIKHNSIKYKIIGNGSNVIFNDGGFDGVVIKLNDIVTKLKNRIR